MRLERITTDAGDELETVDTGRITLQLPVASISCRGKALPSKGNFIRLSTEALIIPTEEAG